MQDRKMQQEEKLVEREREGRSYTFINNFTLQ